MLKKLAFAAAVAGLCAPALALGDPVPGLQVALELNAAPEGQQVVSVTVDPARVPRSDSLVANLSENIAEVLERGRVRSSEDEIMLIARRVADIAASGGEAAGFQQCFRAWCAKVAVRGEASAAR